MQTPPPSEPAFATIPNGASSLLVDPSEDFAAARRRGEAAAAERASRKHVWRKALFLLQCAIVLVLFLRWTAQHSILASAIMALIVFVPLSVLPLLAGAFSHFAGQRAAAAQAQLAAARQAEVERNLAGMHCGSYTWIRRGGEYLAVFPQTGYLYHFGTASGDRHLLLDGRRAVQQVRVSTSTRVEQTTTGSTTHGRRLVVSPSPQLGMLGKGRSKTVTTTETNVMTGHSLEIQFQLASGTQPAWIVLPFGADGHEAENWRLLVSQLGK